MLKSIDMNIVIWILIIFACCFVTIVYYLKKKNKMKCKFCGEKASCLVQGLNLENFHHVLSDEEIKFFENLNFYLCEKHEKEYLEKLKALYEYAINHPINSRENKTEIIELYKNMVENV